MTECWRYGVLFCNSLMILGVYYFIETANALQREIMYNHQFFNSSNGTSTQSGCKVCLGLGEIRYNLLYAVTRWTSIAVCLPSGVLIDKLGNGRSAILFSILPLIGSILFIVGTTSDAPVTPPMYILMLIGYCLLAFGDGALRFVQTRVVALCFPESTLIPLAFGTFGFSGQAISLFVTPTVATTIGLVPAVVLDAVICGFGVVCAVGLAFLLHIKTLPIADDCHNKMLTLREICMLPVSYWLYVMAIGLVTACWIAKQVNLPDYLQLRYGYTMSEASYITGISSLMLLLSPVLCSVLKNIDCDGIMTMTFLMWMVPFYALIGFCPGVSVIIIGIGDGIGITILTVMTWQLLVALSPPKYVGTLGGVMYVMVNIITSLALVASGYLLEKGDIIEKEVELRRYQYFFLMLIIMSCTAVVCGAMMNALDVRKAYTLNSRIRRWQLSNTESTGLMSSTESSNKYCDINNVMEESPMERNITTD